MTDTTTFDGVDVSRMHFVNLYQRNDFSVPSNVTSFMVSDLGQAQSGLIRKELWEQGFQGEVSDKQVAGVLLQAQKYQVDMGLNPNRIEEDTLLEQYKSNMGVMDKLLSFFELNPGCMSGKADTDIKGHNRQLEQMTRDLGI